MGREGLLGSLNDFWVVTTFLGRDHYDVTVNVDCDVIDQLLPRIIVIHSAAR